MFCTKCGAQLEEGQKFCSNCGSPVGAAPAPEAHTPDPGFAAPPPVRPEKPKKIRPNKPRKKGRGLVLTLVAIVVLAAAALCAFRWNAVAAFSSNLIAKTFSEPEEYYRRVEKNGIDKLLDAAETGGDALELVRIADEDEDVHRFFESKLQLGLNQSALSSELLDLIEDQLGVDISWFNNVGLYISTGAKDKLMGGSITAFLNDKDIIDADYAVMTDGSEAYFSVPRLSSQYMKLETGEMMASAGGSAVSDALTEILADEDLIPTLIDRYSEIVINDLTKVEKGTEELNAGGLSGKYTALEVKIDGKVAVKLAKDVLKKAKNDAEIEKLFLAYFKSQGMDEAMADQAFDQVLSEIDNALNEVENTDPADITNDILMTVYVDSLGRIVGRDIKLREDKEIVAEVSYAVVTKGLSFGVNLLFTSIDEGGSTREVSTVILDGSGEATLKKEITGSFDLRVKTESSRTGENVKEDLKVCKINLDAALQNKGFTYEITVTPTNDAVAKMLDELGTLPTPVEDLIRGASLVFKGETGDKKANSAVILKADRKELVTMSAELYPVEEYTVRAPADAVDPDTWAYGIDFSQLQGILADLTEAGVPASLLGGLGGMF